MTKIDFKNLFKRNKNPHYENVDDAYKKLPKRWVVNVVTLVVFVAIFIYFGFKTGFFTNVGFKDNDTISKLFKGLFTPNFAYMFGFGGYTFEKSVVYQLLQTFAIAFAGTLISSILSIPFGFLASRKMVGKWAIISEIILITIRTFPEILFGFILIKGTGFGGLTAMLVLSIHSIGMIGKLYSEQLDLIDDGPLEALNACGATAFTRIQLGVVPQILPNFLNVVLYRFDLNVRTAALLGLCAGEEGGIGYFINTLAINRHWPELGAIIWGLIVMILLNDFASSKIRKKLI